MKRYILAIVCCIITVITQAQYADCILVEELRPTISCWGDDYLPVPTELKCWSVDLGIADHIKITYNIDLETIGALDQVVIYEIDANGNEILLRNFNAGSYSGSLVTQSATGKLKINYWGFYGNCNNLYNGFQIYLEQASCCDLVSHDHYILGKLGIGTTQPQETLHVNGAIRGGGANGEVTLKGDNGSVIIGATDAQTMTFNTDKSKYAFSFNRTNRMTILNNGNIGIGILTPSTKLHINDGALKIGLSTSASERLKNILQFGNEDFVQIGEWEQDDYLSFKARGYNFIYGDVGIGVSNPQYRLDVAGIIHANSIITDNTIQAREIIVTTTGADFVFAKDYQLRPLSEVKAFIQENQHLPEIPSAQEMQENGVSVSELQIQLLQKIEELTLYIIQQEQIIQELRQEVEQLKK
jgi:hypothetical protein